MALRKAEARGKREHGRRVKALGEVENLVGEGQRLLRIAALPCAPGSSRGDGDDGVGAEPVRDGGRAAAGEGEAGAEGVAGDLARADGPAPEPHEPLLEGFEGPRGRVHAVRGLFISFVV